jgi:hypothetical protein
MCFYQLLSCQIFARACSTCLIASILKFDSLLHCTNVIKLGMGRSSKNCGNARCFGPRTRTGWLHQSELPSMLAVVNIPVVKFDSLHRMNGKQKVFSRAGTCTLGSMGEWLLWATRKADSYLWSWYVGGPVFET